MCCSFPFVFSCVLSHPSCFTSQPVMFHNSPHHSPHIITSSHYSYHNSHHILTPSQDMWSLGVLLYVILAGRLPFDTDTLSQQILTANVTFDAPLWQAVSPEAKDLISHLVVVDPSQRYTVEQALQHPWIVNVSVRIITHSQKECSQRGSLRASQLLASPPSLLCQESLGEEPESPTHTNHSSIPAEAIVSDSQLAEDERLWRNKRLVASPLPLHQPSQMIVASSVNEEMEGQEGCVEGLTTPNSKKQEVEAEGATNSRVGTPFRNGLKAGVVASSIFDASPGKKEESPRRAGRGKKTMIQSKNIMNYFSPKKMDKAV